MGTETCGREPARAPRAERALVRRHGEAASSSGRPRIGVTGPDRGGSAAWAFSAGAVWRAGGHPIRMTPNRSSPGSVDGLIIGGGSDVSPELYDADDDPQGSFRDAGDRFSDRMAALLVGTLRWLLALRASPSGIDRERDVLETFWIEWALEHGIPILGICRGMQLLNVVAGGNLIQDVRPLYREHAYVRSVWPRKRVRLDPGSQLSKILCRETCLVNALHRQAVGRLGQGLSPVAWEPSGVIQAIEARQDSYVLGLQWHPELLPQLPVQMRVFRGLVREAHRRRARGPVRVSVG